MTQLNEKALRPNILQHLLYSIISIDEYTPKLNPSNIVVQFQVLDNFDAAYDLSSFIEKSPVNVLDTEASETPNVDGRYNVFVEFKRDEQFPQKLVELLSDVKNLSNDVDWKLQLYQVNDPIDVDVDLILQDINLNDVELQTELTEFFKYSPVDVKFLNECISINNLYCEPLIYERASRVMNESQLHDVLGDSYTLDNSRLEKALGNTNYTVFNVGGNYVVGCRDQFIIIR